MKKTISFAGIHFTIAFTVAYVLTGDILLGSLIAMIEPMVNTVAFYFHEKAWQHKALYRSQLTSPRFKTMSFAVVHFSVAFMVAYLLSGSLFVGGMVALVEPCFNTVAYYFHERFWQKNTNKQAAMQALQHLTHHHNELKHYTETPKHDGQVKAA